uniref:Methyltransf_25 domain-containing protein n=1 Tax=Macrostomum lignano TaxID=282301 RepID=A0A1I8GYF6_9PLAT
MTTISHLEADAESEKFLSQFTNMHYGGQKTSELYSDWSDEYEKNFLNMTSGYEHPERIADIAASVLPDKTCRILDVCAGTGLGGAAEVIGTGPLTKVEKGAYDAIVTSGSFVPGHLGPGQLRVLAGTLKPNGLFCMAMREAYLETDYLRDLQPEMERMQQEGIWKIERCDRMDNYHNGLSGRVFICRRL